MQQVDIWGMAWHYLLLAARRTEARPEFQRLAAKIDPHAPARLRVNGPLSNLKAFQKAFSCPAGAKMVRPADKRCSVW